MRRFKGSLILLALAATAVIGLCTRVLPALQRRPSFSAGEQVLSGAQLARQRRVVWREEPLPALPSEARGLQRPSASVDGRWLVFADGDERAGGELYLARLEQGRVRAVRPLTALNSSFGERSPAFGDGCLLFASDRPGGAGGFDLYKASFDDGECGEPRRLEEWCTSADEVDPGFDPRTKGVVFASDREGAGFDLFLAQGDACQRLEQTDGGGDELEPSFAPTGDVLYFCRSQAGQLDLWRSFRTVEGWLPASRLEELSTLAAERSPSATGSGLELLFTRSGEGGASQLVRARSFELVELPPTKRGWFDLYLMAALLLLALLVALSERFEALDPLWKFYLASLLAHLLFLWLTRHLGLGRGQNAPAPEEGPTFRIQVESRGEEAPNSLTQAERGGELQLQPPTRPEVSPLEPGEWTVARTDPEPSASSPGQLDPEEAPAVPERAEPVAQVVSRSASASEPVVPVSHPQEELPRTELEPAEVAVAQPADLEASAPSTAVTSAERAASTALMGPASAPARELARARASAASEALPEARFEAARLDPVLAPDVARSPAPALAAPNESVQRAALGAAQDASPSAVVLEGPRRSADVPSPPPERARAARGDDAGAQASAVALRPLEQAASESDPSAPYQSSGERPAVAPLVVASVHAPAERTTPRALSRREVGVGEAPAFERETSGAAAATEPARSRAETGAVQPERAAPGRTFEDPRGPSEALAKAFGAQPAEPGARHFASEWNRPLGGPSEAFEREALKVGPSSSLADTGLPAPDLALRPGERGPTSGPQRTRELAPVDTSPAPSAGPGRPLVAVAAQEPLATPARDSAVAETRPEVPLSETELARASDSAEPARAKPSEASESGATLAPTQAFAARQREDPGLPSRRAPQAVAARSPAPSTRSAETAESSRSDPAEIAFQSRAEPAREALRERNDVELSLPEASRPEANAAQSGSPSPVLGAAPSFARRAQLHQEGPRRAAVGSAPQELSVSPHPRAAAALEEEPAEPTPGRLDSTPYRLRFGPQKDVALREGGGGEDTERAVAMGLRYLASLQRPNGSFGDRGDYDKKYRDARVGKSALCLLAFLGAGHVPQGQTEHADVSARAVDFLLSIQDPRSGHFGDSEAYSHGTATYALGELYAMTRDERLRPPLERAVARILDQQLVRGGAKIEGGWSYYYPDGATFDRWPRASITAWQVMALESARLGGLEVSDLSFERARAFLAGSWDESLGAFRYSHDPARLSLEYPTLPGSTPAALFALSLLGEDLELEPWSRGVDYVASRSPSGFAMESEDAFVHRGSGNLYFWYYGSMALFRRGGDPWRRWNAALKQTLLPSQEQDGSWPPIDVYARYAGDEDDDRAYTTAMCVLSLEVYYRYFTPLLRVK
jgi:hypothetical protein